MIDRATELSGLLGRPGVVSWFIRNGVSPFTCCGTIPGTLGLLLETKHVPNENAFIQRLNDYLTPSP